MKYTLLCVLKKENTEEHYYYVAKSDRQFRDISSYAYRFEELKELLKEEEADCDFAITDGVFCCNPEIAEINVTQKSIDQCCSATECCWDNMSLYGLLADGVQDGYVIMDEQPEEGMCYKGMNGIAPMSNVNFSESTMSMYVPIRKDSTLHNKMLVILEDGALQFKPFYFAVPVGKKPQQDCTDCNIRITINQAEYCVYYAQCFSAYDNKVIFADGLINYCTYATKMRTEACKILKALLNTSDEKITWAGSFKSFDNNYGVFLKTSYRSMKSQTREFLLEHILKQDVDSVIASRDFSAGGKYVAIILKNVMQKAENHEQGIVQLYNMIHALQEDIFWPAMYVYRVRTRAYLEKHRFPKQYLVGGGTKEFTVATTLYKP